MAHWNASEFEACVKDSAGQLLAVIRRILRNESDAEETLQETYLSAWRARDHFDGRSTMSTWLHRIAINTALNRLRKNAGDAAQVDAEIEQIEHGKSSRQIDDLALREVVWGAIDQLPDEQRVVLVLRDVEQMDSDEVAERLSLTPAAVRQRLHRARKHVAETLSPELCGAEGMTCGGRLDLLLDMIDGMLADDVRDPVLSHVAACEKCQRFASDYKTVIKLPLETAKKTTPISANLFDRIVPALRLDEVHPRQ